MRALVLLPRIPVPARDGGAIVMLETLRALHDAGDEVHVIALNTKKHHADPALLGTVATSVTAIDVDTSVTPIGAVRALLRPRLPHAFGLAVHGSYWVSRFASPAMLEAVEHAVLTQHVDAIICESLFTACYGAAIRQRHTTAPPVILHAHNVEHRIQERLASDPLRSAPQRWYRTILARQTAAYETAISRMMDGVVALTDDDAVWFTHARGTSDGVAAIPPGVTLPSISQRRASPLHIGFLGSLDWEPNVDGVLWFIHVILPLIRKRHPGVVFEIAGRRVPERIRALHDGSHVIVVGEVEDAQATRASWIVNVVPLRSGSGIRIKILEALAGGDAVVTTSVGCEGIGLHNEAEALIADDPQAFADACSNLLEAPNMARAMGERGRAFVAERYAWSSAIARFRAFVERTVLLTRREPAGD